MTQVLYKRVLTIGLVAGGLFTLSAGALELQQLAPVADGSVRDGDLGSLVNPPVDGVGDRVFTNLVQVLNIDDGNNSGVDHGIVEFQITSLAGVADAELVLSRFGSKGPYPLNMSVHAYEGDGVVTLSDFGQGNLVRNFNYSGEQTVTIDVTQAVADAVANGHDVIGFNLRVDNPSNVSLNGPFVAFATEPNGTQASLNVVVPEPASAGLLLVAGAALIRRRRG
ncbi:MAG: PEP-CTERM sorting domain-containing protein [Phycisphaeraceae bacterium]